LRILTFIKESPSKRLLFKYYGHIRIESFSDSNYVGDNRDRKLFMATALMLKVI